MLVARLLWVALAPACAPALGQALAGRSGPVVVVASVGLWGAWAATAVALLVPSTVSLTALRLAGPAAPAACAAAAVAGPAGVDDAIALAASLAACVACLAPVVADACVDGSSYGAERRFTLRTPLPIAAASGLAWLLAVPVPAAGALLLSAGAWFPGAAASAAGVAGVLLGVRALHRLSRRWLVLVPAGVVVHDQLALADPVLVRRTSIAAVRPAEVGDPEVAGTTDLTLGAGGLVVAIDANATIELPVATGRGRSRSAEMVDTTRVLVAPLRPGAFLAATRP